MIPSSSDHQPVQAILNTLIVLQSHLQLYGQENDNVTLTSTRISASFAHFFADHDALTLIVTRHGFLYNDAFIDRKNIHFQKFAYRMFQHGIAALLFSPGVPPRSLQTFLQLVSRKPAETWDEGGIEACLRARAVTHLHVREMIDSDFLLNEAATAEDKDLIVGGRSRLWEIFSQSLMQGLDEELTPDTAADQEITPQALAEATNRSLTDSDPARQMTFARNASRFLLTLKHENVVLYRNAALERLIAFVEKLSPALRRMFLNNTFNLNITPELAEQFFSGLADDVILDALQDVAHSDSYTPPIIVKLLGKLAGARGLNSDLPTQETEQNLQTKPNRIKDLFRPDDFEKYVPQDYQQTLLEILQSDSLPASTTANVTRLKQTLEQDMLDDHLGAVLFEILRHEPNPQHSAGLSRHLVDTFDHYLVAGHFRKIIQLCHKCLKIGDAAERFPEVASHLSSSRFTTGVLDAAMSLGKARSEEIHELITIIRQPFIAPLLDRLALEKDRTLRRFYLNSLKSLGEPVVAPAVARLADQRWFVSRSMLHLLRELGDPSGLAAIRGCLRHPHPKVVQEALITCLAFKDRAAEDDLLRLLDTEKGSALLRTIMLARLTDSDRVVDRLLDFLRSSTLFDYRLEIRKAVVHSLAISAPRRAIPVLAEILASRSLMHAREHRELKLEILAALGSFSIDDVLPILDEQVKSKEAEVARQAATIRTRLAGRET